MLEHRRLRPLAVAACVAASTYACATAGRPDPRPTGAAGVWEGELRAGDDRLPITVELERDSSGWRGFLDVPDQYALHYPLSDVRVDSPRVAFAFPDLLPAATLDGALDGGRIGGTFAAAAGADTLHGTFELWRRPARTVPYTVQPARFRNGDLELAGSVFLPAGEGPHPAVVLVHGSGPQTRDSYLRWFADRFAHAGIAALIWDKRGTGESGGARFPQTAGSFSDLAADAVAGAHLLAGLPAVAADAIGIWGLSQGAWIGPLAVSRAPGLFRFAVMVSGGGVTPAEQELYDDEVRLRDLGYDAATVTAALDYLRLADAYVRSGSDGDWDRFERAREDARTQAWYRYLDRFPQALPREAPVWTGLRADMDHDPAPVLAALQVPVLLVVGEEDRLTPAMETASRVRRALGANGNRGLVVRTYAGADHALLVQSAGSTWLAQRPADDWVAHMIDWLRRR